MARTDGLTGLLNNRAFHQRVEEEISRVRRRPAPLALIYLDLDNFKQVNDRRGHVAGDALLEAVGDVLRSSIRDVDVAARIGGDEFALLLVEADRDGVEVVAARIITAIDMVAAPYETAGLGASVGVAWFASAPADAETLVHAGDQAMYRAKAAKKRRYAFRGSTDSSRSAAVVSPRR